MKNKSTKRSLSNKHSNHRRHFHHSTTRRSSIPTDSQLRTLTPSRVHFGTGVAHLDESNACLCPRNLSKNVKLLKKDLLKCSNQRPSLLGAQTLQPPRLHQSQQSHTSSSFDREQPARHRSLSNHSNTLYATIDRIGPWPDVSISRIRSDGNDLLRPLKTFRNVKNPRVFSPKYYAALTDNTTRFKFYPSTRNYIDEYRKQKGYLLDARSLSMGPQTSLSLSSSIALQQSDDDQLSFGGTFTGTAGDATIRDRSEFLTSDFSQLGKSPNDFVEPVISNIQATILPSILPRVNPPKATHRPGPPPVLAQQTITLPTLAHSSLHYLNSMNSVEKTYGEHKKTSRHPNPSKVFLLDGRQKKR